MDMTTDPQEVLLTELKKQLDIKEWMFFNVEYDTGKTNESLFARGSNGWFRGYRIQASNDWVFFVHDSDHTFIRNRNIVHSEIEGLLSNLQDHIDSTISERFNLHCSQNKIN